MAGKTQGWKLYKNPKSGIYQIRFRVGGKRYHRSTGEANRAAAQSAAARLVRRVTEGDRSEHSAPDVPLPELVGSWLAEVRSEVSPETLRTWELYAGAHFIPHFETSDRLCSEAYLRDYMRKRLQQVKARTVQKELSSLRRLLTWMAERGLVQEAPAFPKLPRRATGTAHPSGRRKRIDLSPKEMDAIVCALPARTRDGQPLRAYFEVMRETGLRPGTLQRLRAPDDYRPGSQFLRIRAEADKARYARELPLSERAREVLDEVCPDEGILFPKFAWRYPLRTAALAAGLDPDRASNDKPEAHWNTAHANPPTSHQCEEQDSNLHALRTLEPKSSASANSATLACVVISDS